MAVVSTIKGWACECGVERKIVNEVWRDCACNIDSKKEKVKESNKKYWENIWK